MISSMTRSRIWILLTLILAACGSLTPKNEIRLAEQSAITFFDHLAAHRYAEADAMYAGDYSALASLTSIISADDHEALWKNGCEISGMKCLPILRIVKSEKFSLNEFWLTVEFKDDNGKALVLGACCGATPKEMPTVSQFIVSLIERQGSFYVTSLPVFQP